MTRRSRFWLAVLATWLAFAGTITARRAIRLFAHTSSPWFADPWYQVALDAARAFALSALCFLHLVRQWKSAGPAVRWRDRPELRTALYVLAILLFAELPAASLRVVQTLHDPETPPFHTLSSCLHEFIAPLIYSAIGVGLIRYDRRRLLLERREFNECIECGYDLRATSERCPECGTVPDIPSPTAPPTN